MIAMSYKLSDIIKVLEQLGRQEEAEYYKLMVPFDLLLLHRFSEKRVMSMTVDEIEKWYQTPPKPLKYEGWNFWWGEAAFANDDNRNS